MITCDGHRSAARRSDRRVPLIIVIYAAATLLHFAHNAIYLREYPNMPGWLTPTGVWLAWCAMTGIGAIGYWLYYHVSRRAGSVIVAPLTWRRKTHSVRHAIRFLHRRTGREGLGRIRLARVESDHLHGR